MISLCLFDIICILFTLSLLFFSLSLYCLTESDDDVLFVTNDMKKSHNIFNYKFSDFV